MAKIDIDEDEIDEMADIFYALGDRKRIRILVYMLQGMSPVTIAEKLNIPRSSLQVHIEKLINANFLDRTGGRGEGGPYNVNEELIEKLLSLGKKAGNTISILGQIKQIEALSKILSETSDHGLTAYQELSSPLIEKTSKELERLKREFADLLSEL